MIKIENPNKKNLEVIVNHFREKRLDRLELASMVLYGTAILSFVTYFAKLIIDLDFTVLNPDIAEIPGHTTSAGILRSISALSVLAGKYLSERAKDNKYEKLKELIKYKKR